MILISDDKFQLSFFYFFKQFLLHDQEYSSVPRDTTVCALPSKREWTILNLDAAAIMYVDGPLVNRMHPYNGHQRKLLPPVRGERKLLPHNGRCSHHHMTVAGWWKKVRAKKRFAQNVHQTTWNKTQRKKIQQNEWAHQWRKSSRMSTSIILDYGVISTFSTPCLLINPISYKVQVLANRRRCT